MSEIEFAKIGDGYDVLAGGKKIGAVARLGSKEWEATQNGISTGGYETRQMAGQFLLGNADTVPDEPDAVVDETNDSKVYRVIKEAKAKDRMVNAREVAKKSGLDLLAVRVILMRLHQRGRIIRPKAMRYTIK